MVEVIRACNPRHCLRKSAMNAPPRPECGRPSQRSLLRYDHHQLQRTLWCFIACHDHEGMCLHEGQRTCRGHPYVDILTSLDAYRGRKCDDDVGGTSASVEFCSGKSWWERSQRAVGVQYAANLEDEGCSECAHEHDEEDHWPARWDVLPRRVQEQTSKSLMTPQEDLVEQAAKVWV